MIFEEHAKIKSRVEAHSEIDSETFQKYKQSVMSSFNQFKKIMEELNKTDRELGNNFQMGVKNLSNSMLKEMTGKSLSRMLEKQANRVNILRSVNIDSEVIGIIK